MLYSGVHPTLAGIFCAFAIPAGVRIDAQGFIQESRVLIDRFDKAGGSGQDVLTNSEQRGALAELDVVLHHAQTPLQQFEYALHPWISFIIMPLFALANAGVRLNLNEGALARPVTVGVLLGLTIGKPLGIFLLSWLSTQLGIAERPSELSWRMILGLSFLGGIGFTMSLFITALAFTDPMNIQDAKLGILAASLLCGTIGFFLLVTTPADPQK
jgi:NhaA family Na+:H+ antiporter